jgi:hypothetical protein
MPLWAMLDANHALMPMVLALTGRTKGQLKLNMSAWLWTGNPEKWDSTGKFIAYEAMQNYLDNEYKYVYWATPPKWRAKIKKGDRAYIWRTKSRFDPKNGIVATGTVLEEPQEYTGSNAHSFKHPSQLSATGWTESAATSAWKTGIQIDRNLWFSPLWVPRLLLRETTNFVTYRASCTIEARLIR